MGYLALFPRDFFWLALPVLAETVRTLCELYYMHYRRGSRDAIGEGSRRGDAGDDEQTSTFFEYCNVSRADVLLFVHTQPKHIHRIRWLATRWNSRETVKRSASVGGAFHIA